MKYVHQQLKKIRISMENLCDKLILLNLVNYHYCVDVFYSLFLRIGLN